MELINRATPPNADSKPTGLTSYTSLITRRVRMEGFIVLDYRSEWPSAISTMSKLMDEGKLKTRFTVVEGVERAPEVMGMLFSGETVGKT